MDATRAATCNVSYLISLKCSFAGDHIANESMLRLCKMRCHSGCEYLDRGTFIDPAVAKRTSGTFPWPVHIPFAKRRAADSKLILIQSSRPRNDIYFIYRCRHKSHAGSYLLPSFPSNLWRFDCFELSLASNYEASGWVMFADSLTFTEALFSVIACNARSLSSNLRGLGCSNPRTFPLPTKALVYIILAFIISA
jgi:hypothetical protein